MGFETLREKVSDPKVLEAFDVLSANMERFREFQAKFNTKGSKKSVHFENSEGRSYYAFIANSGWLLWYFRRPGLTAEEFSFSDVEAAFERAEFSKREDATKREMTLRIESLADAYDVLAFIARRRENRSI